MDYNKNYYHELGIDKNANDEEIKKAYRKLAHTYHPDKNNGDKDSELKFQKINEANSILSDSKTKQDYDIKSPHGNSYSPGFGGFGNNFNGFEFHFGGGAGGDIFSQFFGQSNPFGNGFNPFGQREQFREDLDISFNTVINLKQIYLDENLIIKFKKRVHCNDCNGTGFDSQSQSDMCEICNGTGINRGETCEYCMGSGSIHSGQCKTCKGEKVVIQDSEVTIQSLLNLRGNIKNSYRGFGHQSKHYRDKIGNLLLNIIVDRNDGFEIIDNFKLSKAIDVHFQDAIDGNEIVYNHIDDTNIKIKLPAKTKNNDVIRVKEKGLLKNNKERDDLYLKINIIINYEKL